MEHLNAAALDITLLVTTVRALRASDELARAPRKLRKQWSGELKQAVAAYLATLWRSDDAPFDAPALDRCRVAAEREMPHALCDQTRIKALLDEQVLALAGYASARHDLWRLAHLVLHLRAARRLLEQHGLAPRVLARGGPGRHLQRQLRRAMADYARTLMRQAGPRSTVLAARLAAAQRLDQRCVASAQALADVIAEQTQRGIADLGAVRRLVEDGVVRPLRSLVEDWHNQPAPRAPAALVATEERSSAEVGP